MAVSDYSTTPGSNTSISGINIAEGWSPADVNNALRQLMADIKAWYDAGGGGGGGSGGQPLDATLTALAALVTSADKMIYATGSDSFALATITAFGRSLLASSNAAAAASTLGVLSISSSSLASPGYIVFSNGFKIQWGTGSLGANSSANITYPTSFASFAVCLTSGGPTGTSSEGDVHPTTASGLTTQAIVNSGNATGYYGWIAVGV